MKKRLFCLALALLLALTALPALAAEGVEDRIVTSNDPGNYLEFSISGNTLTVSGKLRIEGLDRVRVRCDANEGIAETVNVGNGEFFTVQLSLSLTVPSVVTVYYATTDDIESNRITLYPYLWNTIYIQPNGGGYEFVKSLVLDNNLALYGAYADPAKYLDASKVPPEVKTRSNEIAAGISGDYEKIFALHKWVAENIYYDYDAFYTGAGSVVSSSGVLQNKRTVCAGFAALLRDLILAQGIPAMTVRTYTPGPDAGTDTFIKAAGVGGSLIERRYNHDHVEAFVDGRWVIMDPTWDSNNRYENRVYSKGDAQAFRYFDITPEVMAMDHKYLSRGNGSISLEDGAVVGADPLPVKTAVPTTSTVLVNGVPVSFDAYNIDGSNYFKLRDLAYVLSGSEKQFEVTWDPNTGDIGLKSGSAYTPVGGEMRQGDGTSRQAVLNREIIYLDHCVASLTAYNIDGSNYFRLRDLGTAFDFDVTWDGEQNTVVIDTASSYTPD